MSSKTEPGNFIFLWIKITMYHHVIVWVILLFSEIEGKW